MKTIFVSSTFKDMHFERDAIQEVTLPRVKSEAIQYGESISFCDLRWGINTGDLDSEEGSRKVLDVCLDEIDRCKPPMVVILGDRYGWIPAIELTQNAADRKEMTSEDVRKALEIDDLNISVTALEIAYGALSNVERQNNTLFYFRHFESDQPEDCAPEDNEHEAKLDALKAKIEKLTGGHLKHYTVRWNAEEERLEGVIDFAEMLAKDIRDYLLPEWEQKEKISPYERERQTHWGFIEEKNTMFSARAALVDTYYRRLAEEGDSSLVIKAPSGSGKSMLLGNLAIKFRQAGWDVQPFVCGLTTSSNDSADILTNMIHYMETCLGIPEATPHDEEGDSFVEKQQRYFSKLCFEYERTGRRLVFLLDAIDRLADDDNRSGMIFVPSRLSASIKIVITTLPEIDMPGLQADTLEQLSADEKREIIDGMLRVHNRELEGRVIDRMITSAHSDNPLYLSMLVQRLLMMNREDFLAIKEGGDDMEAISRHQIEVIGQCPDSLQKMSVELLREAGKRINGELAYSVGMLLAISRHGLRREDLSSILKDTWSELDFAHFIAYMSDCFILRDDGRYDFSHQCFRDGYRQICSDPEAFHRQICGYLSRLPIDDDVQGQEMVYHCLCCDQAPMLFDYVSRLSYNSAASRYSMRDLFAHCVADGGAWMCRHIQARVASADVCLWVSQHIVDAPQSPAEFAIAQTILSYVLPVANRMIAPTGDESPDHGAYANASLIYNQYAYVSDAVGDVENMRLALQKYRYSLELIKQAEELSPGTYNRDVALRYANVAYQHRMLNELQLCLDNMLECVAIRESMLSDAEADDDESLTDLLRDLATAYDEIGTLYGTFNDTDLEETRVKYYRKALEYRLRYAAEDDVATQLEIGYSYLNIAIAYKDMLMFDSGAKNKLTSCLENFAYAESIGLQLMQIKSDVRIKMLYAAACVQQGNVRVERKMGGVEEYYQKAYHVLNPYFLNGEEEPELLGVYLAAKLGLGISLYAKGDAEKIRSAIAYIEPVIVSYRQIYDRYPTAANVTNLLAAYGHVIMAYSKLAKNEALPGQEHIRNCQEVYQCYTRDFGSNPAVEEMMMFAKSSTATYHMMQGKIFAGFKQMGEAFSTGAGSLVTDFNNNGVDNAVEQNNRKGLKAKSSRGILAFLMGFGWIASLVTAIIGLISRWTSAGSTPPGSLPNDELFERVSGVIGVYRMLFVPLMLIISFVCMQLHHALKQDVSKRRKTILNILYVILLIAWIISLF